MSADTWSAPQAIDDATAAYPARVRELMPEWSDIPKEFRKWDGTPWNRVVSDWFFKGLDGRLVPKEGIDEKAALRHAGAVMRSFEPKHEHKEAAVAYLLSLWFDRYEAKP